VVEVVSGRPLEWNVPFQVRGDWCSMGEEEKVGTGADVDADYENLLYLYHFLFLHWKMKRILLTASVEVLGRAMVLVDPVVADLHYNRHAAAAVEEGMDRVHQEEVYQDVVEAVGRSMVEGDNMVVLGSMEELQVLVQVQL